MPRARSRSSTMASFAPWWASSTKAPDLVEVEVVARGQLLLGLAEAHRHRHQLGLGAVVEVAFDAPEHGGRGVDRLGPRALEGADPHGEGVWGEEDLHEPAVDRDDQPHGPRGEEEQHHTGRHDEHPVEEPTRRH